MESLRTCVQGLFDPKGRPVDLGHGPLAVQHRDCQLHHGAVCDNITKAGGKRLTHGIWQFPSSNETTSFTFTDSKVLKDSTTALHTQFGTAQCLPETEYRMWLKEGYCEKCPLVLLLDGVTWRVIASQNAEATNAEIHISDTIHPTFKCYLQGHKDGGQLLHEVNQATQRGTKDLHDHREFLFKIFRIVGEAPTISHDLTKTSLLNFALGVCFHSDDLKLLKARTNFEECMSLCRSLHLEIENHHPEHGEGDDISVLDMYLDRVSRGVQKTHGWNEAAWHIPERYTPPEYREAFSRLHHKYAHLALVDPGPINIPTLLPGVTIDVRLDDIETGRQ